MARPVLSEEQVHAFRVRACDAAMTLFDELGYEGFSLRALAQKLGCSHTTPYRYFEGKEEIFAEVRAAGFRRFAACLRARLEASRDPTDRLRQLARAYFDFAQQQPAAFRIIFQLDQPSPQSYPSVDEAAANAWGVLLSVVEEAVDAGVLVGRVNPLAHVMWAGIHGVATLQLAQRLVIGIDGAALVDRMTDALIAAHASPRASAPSPSELTMTRQGKPS